MKFAFLVIILALNLSASIVQAEGEKCVVIDLDSTLVHHLPSYLFNPEDALTNRNIELFRQRKQIISSIGGDYFVFPGAKELVRYVLYSDAFADYRVKFFSSAVKERNEDLVSKFLRAALEGDEYDRLLAEGQFQVFSKDDVIDTRILSDEERRSYQQKFDGYNAFGNLKKDLTQIGCDLDWSVLIDDDYTYVMAGQETNYLYTQWRFDEISFFIRDWDHYRQPEDPRDDSNLNEKWYYVLNHFYYAAGILAEARENATKSQTSLPIELHRLQRTPDMQRLDFHNVSTQVRYYAKGMQLLYPYRFLPKSEAK